MKVALDGEKNQPFSVPDGLTFVRVNRNSGVGAADDPNGTIILEAFKSGQKPNVSLKTKQETQQAVLGGIF